MSEGFIFGQNEFTKSAVVVGYACKEVFGIPINNETLATWTDIFRALRAADIIIDTTDNPQERSDHINNALSFLSNPITEYTCGHPDLDVRIIQLSNRIQSFRPQIQVAFVNKLTQICKVTEQLRFATTADQLAHLTKLEGQLTTRLFSMTLPDEAKTNQNYCAFSAWLCKLGRFGNLADSIVDFRSDFKLQLTQIPPTTKNHLLLIRKCIPDAVSVGKRFRPGMSMSVFQATKGVIDSAMLDSYHRKLISSTNHRSQGD